MEKVIKEQLKLEIDHIFESGVNEIRVFEMVKNFIDKRYVGLPSQQAEISDEEIENKYRDEVINGMVIPNFQDGAKWMRSFLLSKKVEWISVDTPPINPTEENRVVGVLAFNGDAPEYNQHIFTANYFKQTNTFTSSASYMGTITHWMRLPNPPKK